eukprot:3647598-Pyramimonas_sp.AAC.2
MYFRSYVLARTPPAALGACHPLQLECCHRVTLDSSGVRSPESSGVVRVRVKSGSFFGNPIPT